MGCAPLSAFQQGAYLFSAMISDIRAAAASAACCGVFWPTRIRCSSTMMASCILNQPATDGTERPSASACLKMALAGSFQGGRSNAFLLAGNRFIALAMISGRESHRRKVLAPAGLLAPTGMPMVQPPPRLTFSGDSTMPHLRFGFLAKVSKALDEDVKSPTLLASNSGWISRVVVKFGVPSGAARCLR